MSVIIPCYNYGRFVGDAIESVLRQILPCEFELIVVDDGSTDNSREVIEKYRADSRVTIIHKENGGVSSARMAGYRASKGEFLVFLDADDMMEPRFLSVNLEKLRKNSRLGISYTPLRLLTENGILPASWPPKNIDYARLARGDNQVPTCCMVRRTAFERAGGYKRRFEPTEDGELWLRIAEEGFTIECATPTPLFTYRLGHASLSRGAALPDYVGWHLPARLGTPPCGLPKTNLGEGAHKVRDYDAPVFDVVITYDDDDSIQELHDTLDSLLSQSYMFWNVTIVCSAWDDGMPYMASYPFAKIHYVPGDTAQADMYRLGVDKGNAPFVILVESGVVLHGRYFEAALREWQEGQCKPGIMPRTWYNELVEKEKSLWLAGVDVVEVLAKRKTAAAQARR